MSELSYRHASVCMCVCVCVCVDAYAEGIGQNMHVVTQLRMFYPSLWKALDSLSLSRTLTHTHSLSHSLTHSLTHTHQSGRTEDSAPHNHHRRSRDDPDKNGRKVHVHGLGCGAVSYPGMSSPCGYLYFFDYVYIFDYVFFLIIRFF